MISKRKRLYRISVGITGLVLLILLPFVVTSLMQAKGVKAAWWSESWLYRKRYTITNAGTTLTDYPIQLTVDTSALVSAGKMQSDCDDIRITDATGTLLNYWLEGTCNTTTTKIWTKISSIPTTGVTIYMYYGNTWAPSTSDGANVFTFFDDFTGGAIDTAKWTVTNATGWSVTGGELKGTNTTGRLTSIATFTDGYVQRAKYRYITNPTNGFVPGGFYVSTSDAIGFLNHPTTDYYRNNAAWAAMSNVDPASINLLLTISAKSASAVDITLVNYSSGASYDSVSNVNNPVATEPIVIGERYDDINTGQTYEAYWDWIYVKKYATTEPVVGTASGEEKSLGTPVAAWKFDEGGASSIELPMTTHEQQISITNTPFSTTNTNVWQPTDNSLGIFHWDASKYPGATVYLEVMEKQIGWGWYAALYTTAGAQVASSVISGASGTYVFSRSGAVTLTDNTDYTVRIMTDNGNGAATIKLARLIIVQTDSTKITATETQIEIGNNESTSQTSATLLTNPKIYSYDASKFSPAPATYFEASLKSFQPTIEQQVAITNTTFSTTASYTWQPTDNSLGIFHWDASKYPGSTVYLEVEEKHVGWGWQAAIYTTAGAQVASSVISGTSGTYVFARSGAVTLTDNTDYTVRIYTDNSNGPATIKFARLIIIQTDSTKITATEGQIDIGNSEKTTETSPVQLTNPKIYYYDDTKFTPAPTTYFEPIIHSSIPVIEQHIDIINQSYSAQAWAPTDNSLGLIKWEADRFPGAAVYFESDFDYTFWGSNVCLYTQAGVQVACVGQSYYNFQKNSLRTGNIAASLVDGTQYSVRLNGDTGNTIVRAARLVIVQSNPAKITDTQTHINLGAYQAGVTSTSYASLTNPKYYQYDSTRFSPTIESSGDATFSATIKIADSADSAYAELYNTTDGTSVAEVSVTGTTNWTYASVQNADGGAGWDTVNADDYEVRVKCVDNNGGGCSASISNAFIILDQSSATGITALETLQRQVNTVTTDADTGYTQQNYQTLFTGNGTAPNDSFSGGTISYFYEATLKTSAGTGYAALYNDVNNVNITNSEVSTTSATYQRQRSAEITSNLPQFPHPERDDMDTVIKNSATNTTSVSSSWIVVRVTNLPTSAVTATAELYNTSDGTQVSGSEVTTTSGSWTKVRSSAITLTPNKEYVVRIKTSDAQYPAYILNAKIIQDQSDASGISKVELIHEEVGTLSTDTDTTYTSQSFYDRFNPTLEPTQVSFSGGSFTYYYEAAMKTSAGTGYAQLYNSTAGLGITGSEISTTSATFNRVRSGDITANMPSFPSTQRAQNLDTILKNSATNTTSVSSSSLIIQANLSTSGPPTVTADLYNITDSAQVSGSEVANNTAAWTRVRSGTIYLTTGKEYAVRVKTSNSTALGYIANAKIIHDQSDSTFGIKAVESLYPMVNTPSTDSDSTYTSQTLTDTYNPANIHSILADKYFEATIKTSAGTGYAQLYGASAITGSEVSTSSASYVRRRSSNLISTMPTTSTNVDTQIKNSASNTTTVSSSWLVVQNDFTIPDGIHDSNNIYHGSLTNSPTWKSGPDCVVGSCLQFDGVNDYVLVRDVLGSGLDFTATDSFTLTAWFRHASASDTDVIIAKYNSTAGGYKLYMNSLGQLVFGVDDDSTWGPDDSATSTNSYADNTWHHVAAVKSGGTGIYLYVDGVLVGSDETLAATGSLANADNFYIGIDGNGTSNPWAGTIDEVKVYPYVRSADQLKQDMASAATVLGAASQSSLSNGLSLHWKFDETTADSCGGNDACDSSGTNNPGVWAGNATPIAGKFGNAIDLDGTGDQVTSISTNAISNYFINTWFDQSWTKRKAISIFNNTASPLTDYQIELTIPYNSEMQPDFDDLRFISKTSAALNYWVQSKTDSVTANVWVKIDSIPASGKTYIFMYYGNAGASTLSSDTNTFIAVHTASTEFSSTQGVNNWYYQHWTGAVYTNMTWISASSWWKSPNYTWSLLWSNGGHPDGYDSARKWVSNGTYSLLITGNAAKNDTAGGDGVYTSIYNNSTQLWNQYIAYNNSTGNT